MCAIGAKRYLGPGWIEPTGGRHEPDRDRAVGSHRGRGREGGPGGRVDRYLQTDVDVQPAFSGSLLVDLGGRALGMNNDGLMRGASLAVPPATLRRVVEALLAHGQINRGFIGIGTVPVWLPADIQKTAGQPAGLLVTSVQADSGAGRAGLLLGDVLLAVEGQALAGPADLPPFLEAERVGQPMAVRI